MKRIFLSMLTLLALPLCMLAQEVEVTVTLTEAGTLQERLSEYDYVDKLTVKGKFNSLDLKYLSEHKGRILDLYYLDLSDIEIVNSDKPYLEKSESTGAIGYNNYFKYYLTTYEKQEETGSAGGGHGLHAEYTYHYYSSSFLKAFNGCTNLKEVHLPKAMGKIVGESILGGCSNLERVVLPEGCESIGDYAFSGCTALKEMSNTSKISHVGSYAFSGTGELKPQLAPLNYVGEKAFYESGIETVSFNSELKAIGEGAFSSCQNLTSLNIPGNVDRIGNYAFSGCIGLKTIIVGEGTRYIDSHCFYNCGNVETMSLPSTIIGVGDDALTGVPMEFETKDGVQYVGKVAYKLMDNAITDVVIRDGTVTIADHFAMYNSSMASLSLPSTLKCIGKNAFGWTSKPSFKSVVLPEGLEEISEMAFNNAKFSNITIPSTVKTIGGRAFGYCTALVRVNWNAVDAVVKRYDYDGVFYGCSGLEQVVFGEGVKRVPNGLFSEGAGNTIGSSNLYSLTSVTFSSTIEEIGDDAFCYCEALKTINWPEKSSLKKIGNSVFDYCFSLEEVVFPEGVETLGSYMLGANTGGDRKMALKSVTIPASVKSIGCQFIGERCDNVEKVISFIKEPMEIGNDEEGARAFYSYYVKNAKLYVPYGTKAKYEAQSSWQDDDNNPWAIVEFGTPSAAAQIASTTTNDFSLLSNETDLSSIIVDGVYLALDSDNGDGYDTDNGCVVLNSTMTEGQIDAVIQKNTSDQQVVNTYQGAIIHLAAGKGNLEIDGQTLGSSKLMVKIGENAPTAIDQPSRGIKKVAYDLETDAFVYLYATTSGSSQVTTRAASATNSIKLYGLKVNVTSSIPPGDANGDGELSSLDIKEIENYILGKPTDKFNIKAANINGDSQVDAADIVLLINRINAQPLLGETGFYLIGDHNGWNTADKNYAFKKQTDGKTWEITIPSEGAGCFKIAPGSAYDHQDGTFWSYLLCAESDQHTGLHGIMQQGDILAAWLLNTEGATSYTIRIVPSEMTYQITAK